MKLCNFEVGLDKPLFLIAGPCVIESREFAIETAGKLKEIAAKVGIPFIYKSSYDKANRSSTKTFRGFGLEEGLRILDEVRTAPRLKIRVYLSQLQSYIISLFTTFINLFLLYFYTIFLYCLFII